MNLRPGEIKILKALSKGEKSYSELKEETKLNFTFLSNYLKNLQIQNLIERDIQNRKYKLKPLSLKALYLNDIIEFLKEQKDFTHFFNWILLFSNNDYDLNKIEILRKQFKEKLRDPKFLFSLSYISKEINKILENFILDSFSKKEREIIIQYKKYLKEYLKTIKKEEDEKPLMDLINDLKLDKGKIFKKLKKATLKIEEGLLHIDSEKFIESLEKEGEIKTKFTEKEKKKLKQLESFLKKHKKLYQEYLEKEKPKIVLLSGFGFKEYWNKYNDLLKAFSEKQFLEKKG
ncbi:MAG: helix-turn-helix domain-containing protein [candidate division WOR-3 bacterium]